MTVAVTAPETLSVVHDSCDDHCLPISNITEELFREPARSNAAVPERSNIATRYIQLLQPQLAGFIAAGNRATLEHSIRVGLIARMGAAALGQSVHSQNLAEVSGLAHDLGKQHPSVASIINSGRVFSTQDRKAVNQHAYLGFQQLYNMSFCPGTDVRERLGNFMGQVALDTLFSHALAIDRVQRGIEDTTIIDLIESGRITEQDGTYHAHAESVQLLTVADVTDAMLSHGRERAYRLFRLKSEGRPLEVNPTALPGFICETVNVPAIDVDTVVAETVKRYGQITLTSQRIASQIGQYPPQHLPNQVIRK